MSVSISMLVLIDPFQEMDMDTDTEMGTNTDIGKDTDIKTAKDTDIDTDMDMDMNVLNQHNSLRLKKNKRPYIRQTLKN
jgi:hypothetical protein